MRRSFAVLALSIITSFASLAQQPEPSPQPQTPSDVHQLGSPGHPGVIAGYITAEPPQSWHGKMKVSFKLKKDGSLDELHPYYQDPDSQRVATEHPELEQKVLENMRQWKYSPFLLEGRPVEIKTAVVLRFDLEKPDQTLQSSLFSVSPSSPVSDIGGAKLPYPLRNWVELDSETMHSIQIRSTAPDYPQMARIAHIQGKVLIRIQVDKEGRVVDEKALSGHPILIQSAMDAVKKWQYKPVIVDGQPVEVLSSIGVEFHMWT
ncbi:MAG TPA: energy transducer TonB [Candidatus Angelobacter sp.]|nr:energy transducer TonB [Candidatus Angelobacter sp.]